MPMQDTQPVGCALNLFQNHQKPNQQTINM
jgi:hypothetical protein